MKALFFLIALAAFTASDTSAQTRELTLQSRTTVRAQVTSDRLFVVNTQQGVIVAPLAGNETVETILPRGMRVTYFGDIFFLNSGNETLGSGDVVVLQSGDAVASGYRFKPVERFDFEAARRQMRPATNTRESSDGDEEEGYEPDLDAIIKAGRYFRMEVVFEAGTPQRLYEMGYVINERALVLEAYDTDDADISLRGTSLADKPDSVVVTKRGEAGVQIALTKGDSVRTLVLEPDKQPVVTVTRNKPRR